MIAIAHSKPWKTAYPALDKWGQSAVFQVSALLLLQLKLLWNSWNVWDLPLADGSRYFYHGLVFARTLALPSLEFSPLYAVYYGIFHLLLGSASPLTVYTAQRLVAVVIVPLLIYALLRSRLSPLVAWGLAAWAASLARIVENDYVVHFFVLIPLVLTYLAAQLPLKYRDIGMAGGFLLAYLVRPEYILALAGLLVWLVWKSFRQKPASPVHSYAAIGLVGLILVLLLVRVSSGGSSGRTWLSFRTLYAKGYQDRHPEWDKNHAIYWREPVEEAFGDADSVTEAIRHNPAAFAGHIFWNARLIPYGTATALKPVGITWWPTWAFYLGVAVFAAAVVIGTPAFRQQPIHALRTLADSALADPLWVAMLIGAAALLLASLGVRPLPDYLVALAPMLLLLVGLGIDALLAGSKHRLAWLTPLAALIALLAAPVLYVGTPDRPVLATVLALPRFDEPYGMVGNGARAFCRYTYPQPCEALPFIDIPADSGAEFLEAHHVRLLILDKKMEGAPADLREYIIQVQVDPESLGWHLVPNTGQGFTAYYRD